MPNQTQLPPESAATLRYIDEQARDALARLSAEPWVAHAAGVSITREAAIDFCLRIETRQAITALRAHMNTRGLVTATPRRSDQAGPRMISELN